MSALQRRISNKARLGGKPKVDKASTREKILKRKGKIEAQTDITAKSNMIAGKNAIIGHGASNRKLDASTSLDVNGGIQISATGTPANPPKNTAVIYVVGAGTATEGDIVIKTTNSSGTTKTATLADFSAL